MATIQDFLTNLITPTNASMGLELFDYLKTQGDARSISDDMRQAADQGIATVQDYTKPYREAGKYGLEGYTGLLEDPSTVRDLPGYEFERGQGMQGLERSAAAKGGLLSGKTLTDISRYNVDYADTKYGEHLNRYLPLIGAGQQANATAIPQLTNLFNAKGEASATRELIQMMNRQNTIQGITGLMNPQGGAGGSGANPLEGMGEGLQDLFGSLGEGVGDLFGSLGEGAGSLFEGLGGLGGIGEGVSDLLGSIGDFFPEGGFDLSSIFSGGAGGGTAGAGGGLGALLNGQQGLLPILAAAGMGYGGNAAGNAITGRNPNTGSRIGAGVGGAAGYAAGGPIGAGVGATAGNIVGGAIGDFSPTRSFKSVTDNIGKLAGISGSGDRQKLGFSNQADPIEGRSSELGSINVWRDDNMNSDSLIQTLLSADDYLAQFMTDEQKGITKQALIDAPDQNRKRTGWDWQDSYEVLKIRLSTIVKSVTGADPRLTASNMEGLVQQAALAIQPSDNVDAFASYLEHFNSLA